MSVRTIKLLSPSRDLLAMGQVVPEGDHFAGSVDLASMPESLLRTFQEFEVIVNEQVFSLLNDIEQRINDLAIKVSFDDGAEAFAEDLQIYPSTGLASFAIRPARPVSREGAHSHREYEGGVSQAGPRPSLGGEQRFP